MISIKTFITAFALVSAWTILQIETKPIIINKTAYDAIKQDLELEMLRIKFNSLTKK